MVFDHILISRIQFAFTISFHILFPAFTIGLASWLVVIEALWLKTTNIIYKRIYKFWVKIFAITFAMGVVSGVVLSYEIGTNWSGFSYRVANVIGPLFGLEVLTAFFLESSFLAIMLFGWNRVNKIMHFIATLIVAVGTLISSFWILSANSWMHTPAGYAIDVANILVPLNWLEIIFNPSFPYRFIHMTTASYLTTAFVVGGVSAWYLKHNKYVAEAKVMFAMAMLIAFFVAPMQIFFGDIHGLNTLKHQPAKIAAIEGIWETKQGSPLRLFGVPDQLSEKTKYTVEIPKLASIILTHSVNGEVKGLKEWLPNERPPVFLVFWSFRIMVAMGLLMAITGLISFFLYLQQQLFSTNWFQSWCIWMSPAGFIAVLAGWFVTEIGRQPYVVYGIVRTSEVVSNIPGKHVFISLIAFIVIYGFIFGAAIYYILQLIKKGPVLPEDDTDVYGGHGNKKILISSIPYISRKPLSKGD